MADQVQAGAVLYAVDVARAQAFYQAVGGLPVAHVEADHVTLGKSDFQLTILKIPESIATSIKIASPPQRRTETPIKLVFYVASIAAARAAASLHSGELNPQEQEWELSDCLVCDSADPEGNIVQFRMRR